MSLYCNKAYMALQGFSTQEGPPRLKPQKCPGSAVYVAARRPVTVRVRDETRESSGMLAVNAQSPPLLILGTTGCPLCSQKAYPLKWQEWDRSSMLPAWLHSCLSGEWQFDSQEGHQSKLFLSIRVQGGSKRKGQTATSHTGRK